MAELGSKMEQECGEQQVTSFKLEVPLHSQEWEWTTVQQVTKERTTV